MAHRRAPSGLGPSPPFLGHRPNPPVRSLRDLAAPRLVRVRCAPTGLPVPACPVQGPRSDERPRPGLRPRAVETSATRRGRAGGWFRGIMRDGSLPGMDRKGLLLLLPLFLFSESLLDRRRGASSESVTRRDGSLCGPHEGGRKRDPFTLLGTEAWSDAWTSCGFQARWPGSRSFRRPITVLSGCATNLLSRARPFRIKSTRAQPERCEGTRARGTGDRPAPVIVNDAWIERRAGRPVMLRTTHVAERETGRPGGWATTVGRRSGLGTSARAGAFPWTTCERKWYRPSR